MCRVFQVPSFDVFSVETIYCGANAFDRDSGIIAKGGIFVCKVVVRGKTLAVIGHVVYGTSIANAYISVGYFFCSR